MFNGRIAGVLPRAQATPEIVGALMTGAQHQAPAGSVPTLSAPNPTIENPNSKIDNNGGSEGRP